MRTKPKPTFLSRLQNLPVRGVALGLLCAMFAFGIGLETAGDVHPFDTSEAAIEYAASSSSLRVNIKGDIDNNGRLEPEDAALILTFAEHLDSPTPEQIRHGDADSDFQLTYRDALRVLHSISVR